MTNPLPPPRIFLTSLFNTLSNASSEQLAPPTVVPNPVSNRGPRGGGGNGGDGGSGNPLRHLLAPHRALLTTLHVLYPSVLLPALDVLDRRLVTRVYVVEEERVNIPGSGPGPGPGPGAASTSVRRQGVGVGVGVGVGGDSNSGGVGGDSELGEGRVGEGASAKLQQQQQRKSGTSASPPPPAAAAAAALAAALAAATSSPKTQGTATAQSPVQPASPEGENTNNNGQQEQNQNQNEPTFHIVRSTQNQQTKPFKRHHASSTTSGSSSRQKTYVVRLRPWSCTCAAFAFAAYPFEGLAAGGSAGGGGGGGGNGYAIIESPSSSLNSTSPSEGGEDNAGSDNLEWEFGGFSIDGKVKSDTSGIAAGVPACKHLLACVLAERLAGQGLAAYMEERWVGREEGAGLVGDA